MDHSLTAADREQRFRDFYEATYRDLLRFIQRRVSADRAEDVAAETFLVVWRRLGELPSADDDARAWTFGVARHLLLNERRATERRVALGVRLADQPVAHADQGHEALAARLDLARAWGRLSEVHQEALSLAVLDGLTAPQAAAVLAISPVAFRLRLSRARRALRLHLELGGGSGHAGPAALRTAATHPATARSPR